MWKRLAWRHARLFVQQVGPAIIKPAQSLWNEVIGFLFLCFAGIFAIWSVRYAIHHDVVRLIFAGFCTLIMAWYGVTSFLRARKISRS